MARRFQTGRCPPLFQHYLEHYRREARKPAISFSKESWEHLLRYPYPGNVRELENIIRRAVILARHDLITTDDLPESVKNLRSEPSPGGEEEEDLCRATRVERLEQRPVFEALRRTGNNRSQAARVLGISGEI